MECALVPAISLAFWFYLKYPAPTNAESNANLIDDAACSSAQNEVDLLDDDDGRKLQNLHAGVLRDQQLLAMKAEEQRKHLERMQGLDRSILKEESPK